MIRSVLLLWIALGIFVGCGDQTRQLEDYQLKSQAELTLNEDTHPHGYGKSECFACHQPNAIHQVDRIGAPSFGIADELVRRNGISSCSGCHGNNGVNP